MSVQFVLINRKIYIGMDVFAKALGQPISEVYESPMINVMFIQSEGVLCDSVGSEHEGFGDGGEYDL